MAIVVLSQGRTGSVAVCMSLQAGADQFREPGATPEGVYHAHFLDSRSLRDPASPKFAKKAAKEAAVRAALLDTGSRRVVVSILRDPRTRLASGLWYQKPQSLARLMRKTGTPTVEQVFHIVQHRLADMIDREAYDWELNWRPLGLAGRPAPGKFVTPLGIDIHFLRFERLEDDFREVTREIFGRSPPLLKLNTGEDRGEARWHPHFRAWCAEHIEEMIPLAHNWRRADAGRPPFPADLQSLARKYG